MEKEELLHVLIEQRVEDDIWTPEEVKAYCKLGKNYRVTLSRWKNPKYFNPTLPCIKIGGKTLFFKKDVISFLQSKRMVRQ
jgi:hypothetical protein